MEEMCIFGFGEAEMATAEGVAGPRIVLHRPHSGVVRPYVINAEDLKETEEVSWRHLGAVEKQV